MFDGEIPSFDKETNIFGGQTTMFDNSLPFLMI